MATHNLPPDLARGAFEAAPDAMVIVDDFGVIRFANNQVSKLFGYEEDEIVGQRVEQLMPSRFRERHQRHRNHFRNSVRPMGKGLELLGRRRDGSEFPIEISLSPVESGTEVLVAAAIRDVSDRKLAERELIDARAQAELAREAADRANQAKSRFLATASHDLRQPLQALALLQGLLRRRVQDPDARDAIGQQDQAINAMSRLVNALLDISKLESGAIKPDPSDFAVAALFEELRREFADIAADKGLRLDVSGTAECVRSDRSLLGQVLRNLVANAIKYTREGSVTLRCLRGAGPAVRLEVLDTGIGIPDTAMPYIYDEFYQVDVPLGRSREGYGLGLSIVRRIVALLGLRLEVQSEVGKGSCFALDLPEAEDAVQPEAPASRGPSAPRRRLYGKRMLLVEDDGNVRMAARTLFELEGCQVTAVASREDALQAADGEPFDIVVSDYHLGETDTGVEVISALRERGAATHAVLLTGDTSSAVKALSADLELRIASKPINTEELLALLDELLVPNSGEHPSA